MTATAATETRYVLLEEEAWIRARWQVIARRKGLVLLAYASPATFLRDLGAGAFLATDQFFLDQDFGEERALGTRFARAVRAYLPKARIAIVTAYPKWMFRDELGDGLLDDVHGKFPEPFKDEECRHFNEFEDWYEAHVWAPLRSVYEEAVMPQGQAPKAMSARK